MKNCLKIDARSRTNTFELIFVRLIMPIRGRLFSNLRGKLLMIQFCNKNSLPLAQFIRDMKNQLVWWLIGGTKIPPNNNCNWMTFWFLLHCFSFFFVQICVCAFWMMFLCNFRSFGQKCRHDNIDRAAVPLETAPTCNRHRGVFSSSFLSFLRA